MAVAFHPSIRPSVLSNACLVPQTPYSTPALQTRSREAQVICPPAPLTRPGDLQTRRGEGRSRRRKALLEQCRFHEQGRSRSPSDEAKLIGILTAASSTHDRQALNSQLRPPFFGYYLCIVLLYGVLDLPKQLCSHQHGSGGLGFEVRKSASEHYSTSFSISFSLALALKNAE